MKRLTRHWFWHQFFDFDFSVTCPSTVKGGTHDMTECGGKRWIPRHLNQKGQKSKKRKGEMKASKPSLQLRNRQYIPHIPKRKNAAVSCFLVSLFEERRVLVGMIWFLHQSKTNKDGTFTNNASLPMHVKQNEEERICLLCPGQQ